MRLVIRYLTQPVNGTPGSNYAFLNGVLLAWLVGLAYFLLTASAGGICNLQLNPAADLAGRWLHWILPIPNKVRCAQGVHARTQGRGMHRYVPPPWSAPARAALTPMAVTSRCLPHHCCSNAGPQRLDVRADPNDLPLCSRVGGRCHHVHVDVE